MTLKKPTIAIIGKGFSGLSLAWYLQEFFDVTIYDSGGSASSISAGLLHKYVGLRAKLNPVAIESELKTRSLLKIAEKALRKSVIISEGIVRVALTEGQKKDYFACAAQYADVSLIEDCRSLDPLLPYAPGILIHSGMTVDTSSYLEGLQKACESKGVVIKEAKITNLDQLKGFDKIVGAMGASIIDLKPFHNLAIHPLKGQLIELTWPSELSPLPYSLSSHVYIAMKDKNHCVVGATYEHVFDTHLPTAQKTIDELMPKALELYPPLKNCDILTVKAGFRATTPSRMPFCAQVDTGVFALVGMGSRGLLYHAYFAEKLKDIILKSGED